MRPFPPRRPLLSKRARRDPNGDLTSAAARLVAKPAARRASYEGQCSTDQKTWHLLPVTVQAKAEVRGLAAGTTYSFRMRPVTKAGEDNWTQVVSLLVG
jgi:hypothetical protein